MNWLWMPITFALVSCATLETKQIVIKSTPSGAVVTSTDGKELGKTPLLLSQEDANDLTEAGRMFLSVRAPGYVDREVIFDVHAESSLNVKLTALDEKSFSQRLISDYSEKTNAMARQLLKIHGLVITRNFDQAERSLASFQAVYPNIASSYVMSADVYLAKGDFDKAKNYLLRARTLDQEDPVILMMLEKVKARMEQ